jgi:F-type H+-transporting ATPase subunit a
MAAGATRFQISMRLIKIILVSGLMALLPLALPVLAEESAHASASATNHAEVAAESVAGTIAHESAAEHGKAHTQEAEEGLPVQAPRLLNGGKEEGFQISNSLVAMFVVAQLATRKTSLIPSGLQNFAEWVVESLIEFLSGIMGDKLARKTFWFYGTVFLFILCANWFGLLPGVGSIGWGHETEHGFHVSRPILRGANADFNMTFALASTFFVLWLIWSVRANGVGGFFSHIFVYHGDATGAMKALLYLIFFLVGFLEVISIMIRPVSLTFRLYGNIYAGESLLEKMLHMGGPIFGWLAALPFFGLELMVGLIQALVFTLLTAVFTSLMCQHGDEHHAEEGKAHEAGH